MGVSKMKILIEISDSKIQEIAKEYHPDLVVRQYCCSGRNCGCRGGYEEDVYDAVKEFESNIIEDKSMLLEILNEYEDSYTYKEVFND